MLNKPRLEKDLDVEVKITRAYCIKEEENARYKKNNFKAVVPEVMKKETPDVLVLQTGGIEITNINVNDALMDASKDIKEYKKEWFNKVEDDSRQLLEIAQNALDNNSKLEKVIILKRLPRYDRSSADLIGIKSELSKYSNAVYDLELTKMGNPENIVVLDLDLVGSGYFRDLLFGNQRDEKYDGIHLTKSAEYQFTYRVIKALKTKVLVHNAPIRRPNGRHFKHNYQQTKNIGQSANSVQGGRSEKLYSDVLNGSRKNDDQVKSNDTRKKNNASRNQYAVPTSNRFQFFNQENC